MEVDQKSKSHEARRVSSRFTNVPHGANVLETKDSFFKRDGD